MRFVDTLSRDRVSLDVSVTQDAPSVDISVSDSGPGVAPEIAREVFAHGFTTKAATAGERGTPLPTPQTLSPTPSPRAAETSR